jgi:replicative DNA helicase
MSDAHLLNALVDRDTYVRISPFIKEHVLSEDAWRIFKGMSSYYDKYKKPSVDMDEFETWLLTTSLSSAKGDTIASVRRLLSRMKTIREDGDDSVAFDDVLKEYVKKDYATRIFNRVSDMLVGRSTEDLDIVASLVHDYEKEVGRSVSKEDLFVTPDLSYVSRACEGTGFEWRLEELNRSLGPMRQGDLLIVAARPETGKTTFAASEMSYWASQLKDDSRPIIWVNNEEASDKVMHRIIQAYFGVDKATLVAEEATYNATYLKDIGKRILVLNDESGIRDVKQLSALFAELHPSAVVFDQLDKVWGYSDEPREDLRIGKLYEWARDVAKKYGPVVAISQVDGSGENSRYIYMNQLRGSKTDKIGEADAIVTIGKTEDHPYTRYLNVPKNKLYGGPRSVEEERHATYEVTIVPTIARYEGVY